MTRWRKNGIERTSRAATAIAIGVGLISEESQLWESVQAIAAVVPSFGEVEAREGAPRDFVGGRAGFFDPPDLSFTPDRFTQQLRKQITI